MGASKELFMENRQDNICSWCEKPILKSERATIGGFGHKLHDRHGSDCHNKEYWSRNGSGSMGAAKWTIDTTTGMGCVN